MQKLNMKKINCSIKIIQKHCLSLSLALSILLLSFFAIAAERPDLQQGVDDIALGHNNMHIGIKALSLGFDTPQTPLCMLNADHLFTPASNTKIITALLALEYLGSNYRFETTLFSHGIVENRVLHGSLYIKGSGDPSLAAHDLSQLIISHCSGNIDIIKGDICIDATVFDHDFFPPGSFLDNIGYSWNAPITGLSLDGKGLRPRQLQDGGLVDQDKLESVFYDIHTLLSALLVENSIVLEGNIVIKATPSDAQLLGTHQSKPIYVLLQHMMKNSDNLYADCLFKKVGAVYTSSVGSWKSGGKALKHLMKKMKIDIKAFVIMDGSGKSRYNLISPSHMVTILEWAHKQSYFSHFFNSLSVAGIDGTLQKRMPELSNVIYGKTGTMQGVSALSGYAKIANGLVAFAILINGYTADSLYDPPCKTGVENAFCYSLTKQLQNTVNAVVVA